MILDSDPIKNHKVGDIYDVKWTGYVRGSTHRCYTQPIEQVCTKLRNLHSIDKDTIRLFIGPQFEAPEFDIKVIKSVSGSYRVEIWDTDTAYKKRVEWCRNVHWSNPSRQTKYPLYVITLTLKTNGNPEN